MARGNQIAESLVHYQDLFVQLRADNKRLRAALDDIRSDAEDHSKGDQPHNVACARIVNVACAALNARRAGEEER